jgi:hypothetical protein
VPPEATDEDGSVVGGAVVGGAVTGGVVVGAVAVDFVLSDELGEFAERCPFLLALLAAITLTAAITATAAPTAARILFRLLVGLPGSLGGGAEDRGGRRVCGVDTSG